MTAHPSAHEPLLPLQPESVQSCPRCRYNGRGDRLFPPSRSHGAADGREPVHVRDRWLWSIGSSAEAAWYAPTAASPGTTLRGELPALGRSSALARVRSLAAQRREVLPPSGIKRRVLGNPHDPDCRGRDRGRDHRVRARRESRREARWGSGAPGCSSGAGGPSRTAGPPSRMGVERRVHQLATRRGWHPDRPPRWPPSSTLSLSAQSGILTEMDDGFRVLSECPTRGLLLYQFPVVKLRRLGTEPPPRAVPG
jgi:hypothetical protein